MYNTCNQYSLISLHLFFNVFVKVTSIISCVNKRISGIEESMNIEHCGHIVRNILYTYIEKNTIIFFLFVKCG